MPKPRRFTPEIGERIAITGVGRSGTTLLVELFTALEFETGYKPETMTRHTDTIAHAGLERPLVGENNPYVIKSPAFYRDLDGALTKGEVKLSHAIVPIRDLFSAAESRRRVTREALKAGRDPQRQPGGLWLTRNPATQEAALAMVFYTLVETLSRHQVPLVLLSFPRLVTDARYCFDALAPVLAPHGVDWREFYWAHASVTRPDLVHAFLRPESDD